jgi:hypothetical protein
MPSVAVTSTTRSGAAAARRLWASADHQAVHRPGLFPVKFCVLKCCWPAPLAQDPVPFPSVHGCAGPRETPKARPIAGEVRRALVGEATRGGLRRRRRGPRRRRSGWSRSTGSSEPPGQPRTHHRLQGPPAPSRSQRSVRAPPEGDRTGLPTLAVMCFQGIASAGRPSLSSVIPAWYRVKSSVDAS